MKQFQPGDIIEITLPQGFGYLQVTHNHPAYPEVVRALPGRHPARPANIAELAKGKTEFTLMLPLFSALKQGMIKGEKVGAAKIPANDSTFPTFRMPIRDKQGNVVYWWFWDGEGLHYEANPDASTDQMPLREITTADALIAKLSAV
ncbi:hypothetical protein [Thalassospira sp.]|uniref:hypothetical protein n=1 Tax=Thalassospira sp. TaxID=1912094 RepID=UPI001B11A33F|nr:hypothetical protein [Thalassospira sp.]MBO6807535.1 hypothetical protein [Thalassospira sp.]MBO6840060.1 hypothetical protein [Thalassospira sp.]